MSNIPNTPVSVGANPAMGLITPNSPQSVPTDPTSLLQLVLATLNNLVNLMGIQEQNFPIPLINWGPITASPNNAIPYVTAYVPFNFNGIVCSALGGVVLVSEGDISSQLKSFNFPESDAGDEWQSAGLPVYSWAFGAFAYVPDSATDNTGTQLNVYTGPQQVRFALRRQNTLTFWQSPFVTNPVSININQGMQFSAQVQYIP